MKTTWDYWINESIYIEKRGTVTVKRKQAILSFCKEGLRPFLQKAGYRIYYKDTELTHIVLRLLYTVHQGKKVKPLNVLCDYSKEQYDLYTYKVDTQAWDSFWNRWGQLQDFEEDSYAFRLRNELPLYIWSWLDVDNSTTVIQLWKEIEEQEYHDEVSKGKDDPYLVDTIKRDYQDRHW